MLFSLEFPLEVVLAFVFPAHFHKLAPVSHQVDESYTNVVVPPFKQKYVLIHVHLQNGNFRRKLLRVLCYYLGRSKDLLCFRVSVL